MRHGTSPHRSDSGSRNSSARASGDRGVPDRYVRDLGHALRPGTSALIVLVAAGSAERYEEHLSALNGSPLRLALTEDMIARLTTGA